MNIAVSTYYFRKKNKRREKYNEEEIEAVRREFRKHNSSFGRRIIHKELEKEGIHISEYKISKIMKALQLEAKYGRKKIKNVYTSVETSERYICENRYSKISEEEMRREIWSMDFTEIKTKEGKVYICGIKSVTHKNAVELLYNCKNDAESAREAVKRGIEKYGKPYMITTDRGSPFVSKTFQELLKEEGIIPSMSRAHKPVDNISIETFWKSMKTEIGETRHLTKETLGVIVAYYEYYYNNLRPHSSLGYCTPMEALHQTVI